MSRRTRARLGRAVARHGPAARVECSPSYCPFRGALRSDGNITFVDIEHLAANYVRPCVVCGPMIVAALQEMTARQSGMPPHSGHSSPRRI